MNSTDKSCTPLPSSSRQSLWHQLAPRLWALTAATVLPLICWGATAAFMSIPPNSRGVNIVAGRELFRGHCGACHFAKMGFPAHHGPNLHEIGRTGATRKPNMTSAQYILESILDPAAFVAPGSRPGMPLNMGAELSPAELRDLIGFLTSCGAVPDYTELEQLEIPDRRTPNTAPLTISRQAMEVAESVLRDKGGCLQCHSLYSNPDDRILAPALFGVGMTDRVHVHESLVRPSQVMKPRYTCVALELSDGTSVSGQLLYRDAHRVVLC